MFDGIVESKYGPVPGVGNSCKKSVRNRLELPLQHPENEKTNTFFIETVGTLIFGWFSRDIFVHFDFQRNKQKNGNSIRFHVDVICDYFVNEKWKEYKPNSMAEKIFRVWTVCEIKLFLNLISFEE